MDWAPVDSVSHEPEGGEMPFLTFETRSRFCFLQSRASRRDQDFFTKSQGSRRDRDFCSLNLRLRDEIEIFCHLISKFETRSRFFNEQSLQKSGESESSVMMVLGKIML